MARLSALFAALAALAVAPVQAASFASASLKDMRVTLFDLNPADGITPSITFPDVHLPRVANALAETDGNVRKSFAVGNGPFDVSVATARSSASATLTGTGPVHVISLTASGSALGALAPGGSSTADATSGFRRTPRFIITANTLVSFSGVGNVNATTTIGRDAFGGFDRASAAAFLNVFGPGPGGSGSAA